MRRDNFNFRRNIKNSIEEINEYYPRTIVFEDENINLFNIKKSLNQVLSLSMLSKIDQKNPNNI